jgi:Integrase core domain
VTQQARQFSWQLQEREPGSVRFLLHDRDGKFAVGFDTVFASEGIEVIKTPVQAPNANAYAERVIRSIREECLDRLLILNQAHLRFVLRQYLAYYHERRPHQGLGNSRPRQQPSHPWRRLFLVRFGADRSWAGSSTTTPSPPELATHTAAPSPHRCGCAGRSCPQPRQPAAVACAGAPTRPGMGARLYSRRLMPARAGEPWRSERGLMSPRPPVREFWHPTGWPE